MTSSSNNEQDRLIAEARRARELREKDYREQALKLFPPVCGRCGRAFEGKKLKELTVHHKNHNHDDNPSDGSNWELLCTYCHEHEHSKIKDSAGRNDAGGKSEAATFNPFADLKARMESAKRR